MVLCRDIHANKRIGFAHEVGEDRITRRQWFYCDDDAAKQCVLFNCVYYLVCFSAIDERIDNVG